MNKTISIFKYHLITANEFEAENLTQNIRFAAFADSIENEMLGTDWVRPIGDTEEILISDIIRIDFLGKEEIVLNTEMDRCKEDLT